MFNNGDQVLCDGDIDTLLGIGLDDPVKPLILYLDRRKSINCIGSRIACLMLVEGLLVRMSPDLWFILATMLIVNGLGYLWWRGILGRTVKPVMELRQDGLAICTSSHKFAYIPWQEIEAVRVKELPERISITPKSVAKTYGRGDLSTQLKCWFSYVLSMTTCREISIQSCLFALSCHDVVAQIELRRSKAQLPEQLHPGSKNLTAGINVA